MESIEAFLSRARVNNSGDGSGCYSSGYGYGWGIGYGGDCCDGYGCSNGGDYGSGRVNGSGSGCGSGCGYGFGYSNAGVCGTGTGVDILFINNFKVHFIDGVPTVIYSVKGNIARGAMLRKDMTLIDCYVAKVFDCFAHGETVLRAYSEAQYKARFSMSVEELIDNFCNAHSDYTKKYSYADLFQWHSLLTGSCELGRREWCKERNITENDSFTVAEFCELTQDAYGGEVIKQLINKLKTK